MTKTGLRDDTSLAAIRSNGGRDQVGIGGRLHRNPQFGRPEAFWVNVLGKTDIVALFKTRTVNADGFALPQEKMLTFDV